MRRIWREVSRYAHTTYIKYDPPHFLEWQCPEHPDAKTIHKDEYIFPYLNKMKRSVNVFYLAKLGDSGTRGTLQYTKRLVWLN